VVQELLRRAGAHALIYDPCYESVLSNIPLPLYCTLSSEHVESISESLPSIYDYLDEDIAFIFHTSGSTSGSPKLVPLNYRWMKSAVAKSTFISKPIRSDRQDVTTIL